MSKAENIYYLATSLRNLTQTSDWSRFWQEITVIQTMLRKELGLPPLEDDRPGHHHKHQ